MNDNTKSKLIANSGRLALLLLVIAVVIIKLVNDYSPAEEPHPSAVIDVEESNPDTATNDRDSADQDTDGRA